MNRPLSQQYNLDGNTPIGHILVFYNPRFNVLNVNCTIVIKTRATP
jgi:hypothetical protein